MGVKRLKMTKNRQLVYELLSKSNVPMTAYEMSRNLEGVSLTTVYRALDYLVASNVVRYFVLNDFKYYYLNSEHKHFFQCTKCGKFFPLDECYMKEYEEHIEKEFGFKISEHFVFFTGLCKECQK